MIQQELDYMINIGFNGGPYYVWPIKLDRININTIKNYNKESGIYFLFRKGVVVYIGASRANVYSRIIDHIKDKDFDSYFIMTCIDDNGIINKKLLEKALKAESYLIRKFKPEYNTINNLALQTIRN